MSIRLREISVRRLLAVGLGWGLFLAHSGARAETNPRPPQFVLLAFDNCLENESWNQVTQFLEEMNSAKGDRLRFTFFLSGTALLQSSARGDYTNPKGERGKAKINFGGSEAELLQRVGSINRLFRSGNEIASHAVGHYDGGEWDLDQWHHELRQYNRILEHFADVNRLQGEARARGQLAFKPSDLRGFRAPYLSDNADLREALLDFGFLYDTSDTDQGFEPTTWPRRFKSAGRTGLWNFGLGFITVPRLTTKIPAMDYNFCYRQNGGCPEKYPDALRGAEQDADDMYTAYANYFLTNYNGNRAPVHIGHHFQPYRGGYYNRALMKFARAVCGQPEVRCATYSELAKFMTALPAGHRDAYQAARFPRAKPLTVNDLLRESGH